MLYRAHKESALDTIRYEVKMLRFCEARLREGEHDDSTRFLLLEGFLLHYRNLLRVFSGLEHRPDDLSTRAPEAWVGRALTPEELAALQEPAKKLDGKWFKVISKYLQHCTTLRHEVPQGWDIEAMASELSPVLVAFDRLDLPPP